MAKGDKAMSKYLRLVDDKNNLLHYVESEKATALCGFRGKKKNVLAEKETAPVEHTWCHVCVDKSYERR